MNEDEAFVQAIAANPNDDTLRLVYADWLEERGDPRGAYLRLDCLLDASPGLPREQADELESRLGTMASQLNEGWLRAMARRIEIVLHMYQQDWKINVIKTIYEVIREMTGLRSLHGAVDLVEKLATSPTVTVSQVASRRQARRVLQLMRTAGATVSTIPEVD